MSAGGYGPDGPAFGQGWQPAPGGYPPPSPPGYPPPYPPVLYPPKPPKGWEFGLPPTGPGSVANPGKRLLARLLDGLFFLPVSAGLVLIAILVAAPHYGPLFPSRPPCPAAADTCPAAPFPGLFWLELTILAAGLAGTALYVVVDAAVTSRWGRTPGKAIMHIRPIHLPDRAALGFWRALGRAAGVALANFLSWIGYVDYLWCLWDRNGQCLHDKVVDTIVVTDV